MERDAWVTIDSRKHHHTQGFGGIATNVYDLAKIGRIIFEWWYVEWEADCQQGVDRQEFRKDYRE